jgi:hypothetical protein
VVWVLSAQLDQQPPQSVLLQIIMFQAERRSFDVTLQQVATSVLCS